MLPTARSAPSHSLARALSGLSSGAAGDSAEFLQGEWGLMFGERLRLLARTQSQSQSQRTPFAMPTPRPAALVSPSPPPPPLALPLSTQTPYNPLFWQHKVSSTPTPFAANVSLLHPALPFALQPPALVLPNSSSPAFVAPVQAQPSTAQHNELDKALERSSRKRKRGTIIPSPTQVTAGTNASNNAPVASLRATPADAPRLVAAAMSLKSADALQESLQTPTDAVASSSAPEVALQEARAPRKTKERSTVLPRTEVELAEQHTTPRSAAATTVGFDAGPLDAVMQEARARRRIAPNPVTAERALSRALGAMRQQHAAVLHDARVFDVGLDFDDVGSQLDAELALDEAATSSTLAVPATASAPRVTPIRRDTNLGNKDPQSLEFFRASFVEDVARGDARQAVRRMTRLLCKKSFLRHPERGAFFDVAVHALLQKGEYAAACSIHKWMTDEGFLTSPAVLTGLICALNDGEGVLEALVEMPAHVDEPLLTAALSRLQVSLPAAQLEELAEGHRYQRGRGVTCVMINAHARGGDLPAAARWLERYRTTPKPGHALEPAPYAALMAAHLRAGDSAAALGVLALMQADDVAPTLGIYNMLLAPRAAGHGGVERAFRVAKIIPPELWARADAFTFGALWKAHERWRAALVLRTGAPQPAPRALFQTMMARAQGVVGTRLLNVALRVLMLREDYAGALVALDAHRAPDARTHQAVLGALWRRMRGEVDAQRVAEERARRRELEMRDLGRVPLHAREEEPGRELARWTDRMLAEPGGLRRRGSWLRSYVARGEGLADYEGMFEWLLNLGPELERERERPGTIDVRPLRVLLRRAILASKGVSVLAPIEVQTEVFRTALAKARAQMLPATMETPPSRKKWAPRDSKWNSRRDR